MLQHVEVWSIPFTGQEITPMWLTYSQESVAREGQLFSEGPLDLGTWVKLLQSVTGAAMSTRAPSYHRRKHKACIREGAHSRQALSASYLDCPSTQCC